MLSFVKIDTEGFDKTILLAYKPLLRIKKPIFYVEWFDPWWVGKPKNYIDRGSQDLMNAIAEIGYVPLNPSTGDRIPNGESRHGHADILCIPAERAEGKIER